jgi:hypothetical protein
VFEQFMRDWDAYNNSEPFWTAMHGIDMELALVESGFNKAHLFHAQMQAVVAHSKKTSLSASQDFGREPMWHAYGARRSI